jgi:amino acid transporter
VANPILNINSKKIYFLINTRITFAAARDSNLPKILSMLNTNYMTPTPSILLTVITRLA